MIITEALQNAGLPDRETKMYLALLELGEAGVIPITQKAGIDRTYGYDILESLKRKGLVSQTEKDGKRKYLAEDPKALESLLAKRLASVKEALPELRSIYSGSNQKPVVRFYEGKESLVAIYLEMEASSAVDFIASPSKMFATMGKDFFQLAAEEVVRKKIIVRELITAELGMPEYTEVFSKDFQESRLLPPDIVLDTDTILYENKVVLISYLPTIHAVVLEGSSIVQAQRAQFEYMWRTTPGINQ